MSQIYKYDNNEGDRNKGLLISALIHSLLLLITFIHFSPHHKEKNTTAILVTFTTIESLSLDKLMAEEVVNGSSTISSENLNNSVNTTSKNLETTTITKESPVAAIKKNNAVNEYKTEPTINSKTKSKENSVNETTESKKSTYSDLLNKSKNQSNSGNNSGQTHNGSDEALNSISTGSGKVGEGLGNRKLLFAPQFKDNSQKTGKVTISICVNSEGNVISAEFKQKGSTTNDASLIDIARVNALKYKFEKSSIPNQCGSVLIEFKVQ